MHRSQRSELSVKSSVTPNVVNDDTDGLGAGVALAGYGAALAIVHIGVSGDTLSGSVKILPVLQESDDGTTFTTVDPADVDGAFTLIDDPLEDDVVQVVGYKGTKAHLRVALDVTGTHTNGTPCSAVIVRGYPTYAPTN